MNILEILEQYTGDSPTKIIVSKENPEDINNNHKINLLNDELHKNILISGPTGCGKEFLTIEIANRLGKTMKKEICINCAGLTSTIARAEIFGYVPGSHTNGNRKGKDSIFEGTDVVFLDELHCLPTEIQASLLRTIEYSVIQPSGGQPKELKNIPLIIAAIQPHRKKDILEDLLNRFDLTFNIPRLNQRLDIIPKLVALFLYTFFIKNKICRNPVLDEIVLLHLILSEWKGNIRELKMTIKESFITNNVVYPVSICSFMNNFGKDLELIEAIFERDSSILKKFLKKGKKCERKLSVLDLWNYDIHKKINMVTPKNLLDFYSEWHETREKEKKQVEMIKRAKEEAELIVQRDIYVRELTKEMDKKRKKEKKRPCPKTLEKLEKIVEKYGTKTKAAKEYFHVEYNTIMRWYRNFRNQ